MISPYQRYGSRGILVCFSYILLFMFLIISDKICSDDETEHSELFTDLNISVKKEEAMIRSKSDIEIANGNESYNLTIFNNEYKDISLINEKVMEGSTSNLAINLNEDVTKNLPDRDIEYTNISVIKEEMMKGSRSGYEFAKKSDGDGTYILPRTIHFIWEGSPIPDKYIKNIKTFGINKDFKIILWTDNKTLKFLENQEDFELKDINSLTFVNSDAIKEETQVGSRTDIYRYEILYQFGGIYVDTDSVCLQQFPKIMEHSFVSHVFGFYSNVCSGIIGMPKHSGFLGFALETLKINYKRSDYKNWSVPEKTGPTFFTSMFVHYNDANIHMIHQDYLILQTEKSIIYQTMDGSWLD